MIKPLYTATAFATGGRNGKVTSSDNVLDLEVRTPKELGGSGGEYTNPEQLFAAGYAACFDSALSLVIRMAKVEIAGPTNVTAHVSIGKNEAEGYGLGVILHVNVPGVSEELAKNLVEKAHQVCPYSNATRGNITVELNVSNN
ncbi:organic hydroperoxide resistance protein [Solitalea canadensis]|uniref:Peroxiredoxin, Ohr subfamily n=1 Tax=Solitalea canadensis (strain ATCC 29591 / DSM 3403 / JCM 21819 / LMG 8368 / NBRC 15130 / NCIMB 12057 / USAM 9D) TaxID=929556 RepID=H8KMJ4_SOLCM|nr:organic hydroperoxide resistance protein [Solitalea canadensis]AFD08985.1 peroxiredoxin, Ohr subfamily [Solitalea canadensis DSM 3403]